MKKFLVILQSWGSLLRAAFQMMYGVWKIVRLPKPIVTIFGGSRFSQKSLYAQKAHDLAQSLVEANISVITGGGPGIMQAANCGAAHGLQFPTKARSIGITVKGLQPVNFCAQETLVTNDFYSRKWLMVQYSSGFVIFPGGFGTLDELGQIITLMQTKKLSYEPVVLIGVEYWAPFIAWLHDHALKNKLINEHEFALLQVTDDIDEALEILKKGLLSRNIPI